MHLCVNVCPHVPEVLGGAEVRFLLFLPLAHVLGRFVEIAVICSRSGVLGHVPDVRNLVNDLGSFRPTAVLAVPRVFEKIYNAADAKATGAKQKVFRLAAKTAIAYSRALDTPEGPSRRLKAQRAALTVLSSPPCAPCWAGRSPMSSPGAAHWASAWDTSTVALESPSLRATA